MAYQFIHIETYARSSKNGTSSSSIIGEALRQDGFCPHVTNPQQPVPIMGPDLETWYSELEATASEATDSIGRKIRKDARILLAGVASWPVQTADLDAEGKEKLMMWAKETARWFEEKHGSCVAVMHMDEKWPHLHMYAAPDLQAGKRANDLHPGEVAKATCPNQKLAKKHAFSEAMRGYQDGYFQDVAARYGMARTGPARRRLTREEWKSEQAALKQTQEFKQRVESEAALTITETAHVVDKVIQDAEKLRVAAEQKQQEVERYAASQQRAITRSKAVLDERQKKLDVAEEGVTETKTAIELTTKSLVKREAEVAEFESATASTWGILVSAVTLGRKGFKNRIRVAQSDERRKVQAEVSALEEKLKRAQSERSKRLTELTKSAEAAKRRMTEEVNRAARLEQELKMASYELEAARSETQPLQSMNAELARDLRVLEGKVAEIHTWLNTGRVDEAFALLSKLATPAEKKPVQENKAPSPRGPRPGSDFDRSI